jgi:hypothetical protein
MNMGGSEEGCELSLALSINIFSFPSESVFLKSTAMAKNLPGSWFEGPKPLCQAGNLPQKLASGKVNSL